MNERQAAFSVLLKFVNRRERLDDLSAAVVHGQDFSPVQLRLFRQLTAGVVRHLLFLDDQIRRLYKGRFNRLDTRLLVLLRMGFYELYFIKNIPEYATLNEYVSRAKKVVGTPKAAGLVNALLRGFIRGGVDETHLSHADTVEEMSRRYSFPTWMLRRWIGAWGKKQVEELCRAYNRPPHFTIRVNQTKIKVDAFLQKAAALGIQLQNSKISPVHFKLDSVQPLLAAGFFEQGLCSVQDESAAIPLQLLEIDKDTFFLDVCAAPGGKFTQALEAANPPRLAVALDNDLKRLKKVRVNLNRLNLSGVCVLADARHLPFKGGIFDRILIDAPCSGQGVIRKHPDIKWRRSAEEIDSFSRLQKQILNEVPRLLAGGGMLVYSTCSIDPQENEMVVEGIVSTDMEIEKIDSGKWARFALQERYIRTFPSTHGMDGSFAVLFRKGVSIQAP